MPQKGDSSPQNIKTAPGAALPRPATDAAERSVRILPPPHARYQVADKTCARPFCRVCCRSLRRPESQGHHKPVHKYDVTAGKDMPAWSSSLFAFSDNVQVRVRGIYIRLLA